MNIKELRAAFRSKHLQDFTSPDEPDASSQPDEEDLTAPETQDKEYLKQGYMDDKRPDFLSPMQHSERTFASLYNRPKGFTKEEEKYLKGDRDISNLSAADRQQLADVIDFASHGKISKESLQTPVETTSTAKEFVNELSRPIASRKGVLNAPARGMSELWDKTKEYLLDPAQNALAGSASAAMETAAHPIDVLSMKGRANEAFSKGYTGEDKYIGLTDLRKRLDKAGLDPKFLTDEAAQFLAENALPFIVGEGVSKLAGAMAEGDRGLNVIGAVTKRPNANPGLRDYWPVVDAEGNFAYVKREVPWETVKRGMAEGKYKGAISGGAPVDETAAKLNAELVNKFGTQGGNAVPENPVMNEGIPTDTESELLTRRAEAAPIEEADIVAQKNLPSMRAAKAAQNDLAMKLNPNTVQDLQRAALISGDTDPLAVRLGVAPKGHVNDTLKQAESIIDKPLSLFDSAKEAPRVEKAMTTMMKESWQKIMNQGVVGNIAHPFRLLDDVAGSVGVKAAYDKITSGIGSIIPNSVKRGFLGSAGMEPGNFAAYQQAHQEESIVVRDLTNLVSEKLGKDVTGAESNMLEGLMRGQIDPAHVIPSDRNLELLKRYADVRETLDHLGEAATQMGLLDNEVFMQNVGKYLPQYYKGTELEGAFQKAMKAVTQPIKTIGERMRSRKIQWDELNLTTAGRNKLKEMGAVQNPAYSAGKGTLDIGQDLANARFSRRIAGDSSMAMDAPVTGRPEGDWVKMGDSKAYGDLAGKYVHPDVARNIKDLHAWTTKGQALKLYDQMNGLWKLGKTAYNPSTWARNAYTNAWLFEGATGRSWLDPRDWGFFKGGLSEYISKDGELYKQLERRGLFGKGSADNEVRDNLRKMLAESTGTEEQSMLGKIMSAPGKGYRAMDDINRYLLAKHAHESGMGINEVVAFAKRHGIDYGAVGPVIQMASRVVPFIKYPFKVMPLIAEYLAARPATMMKYPAILGAAAYYAKKRAGWTDEDEKKANALMGNSWMKNRSLWMLPFKDDKGRTQYLDTSFFVPNDADVDPLSSPVVAIGEAMVNKDHFVGRDIRTPADQASGRSWFKTVDFLTKKLAPSLMPGPGAVIPYESAGTPVGGYSADKLVNTLRGHQDYLGRTRNLATVLADIIFGLKVIPVDFKEMQDIQARDAKNQHTELKRQTKQFGADLERQTSEFEKKKIQANIDRNNQAMKVIEEKYGKMGDDAIPGQRATAVPTTKAAQTSKPSVEELRAKFRSQHSGAR